MIQTAGSSQVLRVSLPGVASGSTNSLKQVYSNASTLSGAMSSATLSSGGSSTFLTSTGFVSAIVSAGSVPGGATGFSSAGSDSLGLGDSFSFTEAVASFPEAGSLTSGFSSRPEKNNRPNRPTITRIPTAVEIFSTWAFRPSTASTISSTGTSMPQTSSANSWSNCSFRAKAFWSLLDSPRSASISSICSLVNSPGCFSRNSLSRSFSAIYASFLPLRPLMAAFAIPREDASIPCTTS